MHLVLSPRVTEDSLILAAAATKRGWEVTRLAGWRVPVGFAPGPAPAIHGEPLFARIVAAQCGLVLLEPPLDWLARLPAGLLRRRVQALRFGDLGAIRYPAFVKPPDDKLFPARVYESPADLLEYQSRQLLADDQPVLVSDPVHFRTEYRVHLLGHKAVSVSRYCVDGELAIDGRCPECATAAEFAQEAARVAAEFTPPAVVIDVGQLQGGEWAVIEANPAFGAGIYGGDPDAILGVLQECCRPAREAEGPALRQFFFPVTLE